MKKLLTACLVICLLASAVFASGAKEASFPDPEKVITIVVPFSAGGGTDMAFRPIAEIMKKNTGVNVIISNIPGAGSATGTNEVLQGEADGYTILAGGTHTIGATMQGLTEGYNELDGLAGLNWDPFVVAVHKSKPWNSFEELVAAAEKDPGSISLGNAGMGGATGVASVGLNLAFDKSFNVTPFNGGADLIASVLGGHCDVGIFSQSEIVANKDSLKPLVILYQDRSVLADLASVPTLKETGYDISIPAGSFKSFSVKTGTPEEVQKILISYIEDAINSPEYADFMKKNGLIPAFTKGTEYNTYEEGIIAEYMPIMKEAGLYKE